MRTKNLLMVKSILQRMMELVKQGEPTHPLSSNPETSTRPYMTDSNMPVHGPKRKLSNSSKSRQSDYAHGQRGKNEAGKTQRGITTLPSEAPLATRQPPIETGGYVNDN